MLKKQKFSIDEETITTLVKVYNAALERNDQGIAELTKNSLKEMADAEAALSRAAILTAFVSAADA